MDREGQHVGIPLPEGSWWDWDVITWDAGQFRLAAGHDLTYSHGLELGFGDPVFVSCPTTFHDPVFRVPTSEERMRLARRLGRNHRFSSPSMQTRAVRNPSHASSPRNGSRSCMRPF